MTNLRFEYHDSKSLKQFQSDLTEFETEFIYPLDETNNFYISHGSTYSTFFDQMGEARFLLVFLGSNLIGMISVVKKKIRFKDQIFTAMYVADLKLSKPYRGKNISQHIYWEMIKKIPTISFAWGWSVCFFVGMIGQKGSIINTLQHPFFKFLITEFGTMSIYFSSPKILATLPEFLEFDTLTNNSILCLSSIKNNLNPEPYVQLTGIKDIILTSTKEPLPLVHFQSNGKSPRKFIEELRLLGNKYINEQITFCFSIDSRFEKVISFLETHGVTTTSKAIVGGFYLDPIFSQFTSVSINTNEI